MAEDRNVTIVAYNGYPAKNSIHGIFTNVYQNVNDISFSPSKKISNKVTVRGY